MADTLFGNNPRVFDHKDVASAIFSQPPAAAVGLTEEEAAKGLLSYVFRYLSVFVAHTIDVYISKFTPLRHTISKRQQKTMIKLIVDRVTDRYVS